MKKMFQAFKCCYLEQGCCLNCPYENDPSKCDNFAENIKTVFDTIGEFIEFENIKNIIKIVVEKGEEHFENKN